ncbi:hypothetical protein [Agathobaculum sp. Marseille-P7918]|uniref:hypothetical protein n=1 Tax=Agathobaculum sp. Marseille-P7918 TaxID=2479843 RepID=UPI003566E532
MKLTPDDLRIRQALEQIETPMYDIAGAVREQRAHRSRRMPLRSPQRLLAAILAAVLLTATAAAAMVQFSGGWNALFGQNVMIPDGLATPVRQTQTIDGCTITLEDAIVSEDDVAVLYSFRYADNSTVNTDSRITLLGNSNLLMDGSDEYCMSSSGMGSMDSQDPSVEYYYEAFSLTEDPGDRQLTLTIDPASCMEQSDTLSAPMDLAAIYQSHPVTYQEEDNGAQRLTALQQQDCADVMLPQSYQFPEIQFAGVAFQGDILCVSLCMPEYDSYDSVAAQIESLRDIRTDRLYFGSLHSYGDTNCATELCETQFEGLTEDDLPYLEPQITYQRYTPLTEEGWSFSFCAPSAKTLTRELNLEMADGIRLTQLNITPLGVELFGTMPVDPISSDPLYFDDRQKPDVTLVLQDGTTVRTVSHGSSLSSDSSDTTTAQFGIEYQYQTGSESRRFLQTETIAAIRINHITISIEE